MKFKKVAFYTLGCKVNQYETESLKKQFMDNGFEPVDFSEKSDVYVVNSCTVTSIADKKTRNILRRAKKLNNEAIIIGDNILHKGLVCLPLNEVPRRQRTIVRNMKAFIDYIYANDNIRTSILPIGDGLMVNNILNTL